MTVHSWIWDDLVGWAVLPLVAVLIIVFLYRRFVAEFPLFFTYLLATEIVGVVRLAGASAPTKIYYYIYWISDIVYTLFALTATYELFIKRLFPGFYKARFYRYIFWVATVLTAFAIAIALIGGHFRVILATIYVYSFVRAAILFFFVTLMLVMGRQWSKLEFGIAIGFGLDVSMSLAALGIWSHSPGMTLLIARISVVVYDIVCLIWLYCFWTAPKTPIYPSFPTLPTEALHEAKKWEESLKDFITPGKRQTEKNLRG